MKTVSSPRLLGWPMLLLLGLSCLPFFAAGAFGAAPSVDVPLDSAPHLQANFIFELVSDRPRLIQVSLVAVAFGVALLWWKR
jgi:hypothetical protein